MTRARNSCEWETVLSFSNSHPMLTHMDISKGSPKSKIICSEYKYFISKFGLLLRSTKDFCTWYLNKVIGNQYLNIWLFNLLPEVTYCTWFRKFNFHKVSFSKAYSHCGIEPEAAIFRLDFFSLISKIHLCSFRILSVISNLWGVLCWESSWKY